jgi:hypothetical protein
MHSVFQAARMEDFECSQNKAKKNVSGNKYAYYRSLTIIQCIHVLKHYITPHKYMILYVYIQYMQLHTYDMLIKILKICSVTSSYEFWCQF